MIAHMVNSQVSIILRFSVRPMWSASELAWLVIELAHVGKSYQHAGHCLGNMQVNDLCVMRGRLGRIIYERGIYRLSAVMRLRSHERDGHDLGCTTWGVSLKTLEQLVVTCGDHESALIVLESVQAALEQATSDLLNGVDAWGVLSGEISTRITPRARKHWKKQVLL